MLFHVGDMKESLLEYMNRKSGVPKLGYNIPRIKYSAGLRVALSAGGFGRAFHPPRTVGGMSRFKPGCSPLVKHAR